EGFFIIPISNRSMRHDRRPGSARVAQQCSSVCRPRHQPIAISDPVTCVVRMSRDPARLRFPLKDKDFTNACFCKLFCSTETSSTTTYDRLRRLQQLHLFTHRSAPYSPRIEISPGHRNRTLGSVRSLPVFDDATPPSSTVGRQTPLHRESRPRSRARKSRQFLRRPDRLGFLNHQQKVAFGALPKAA